MEQITPGVYKTRGGRLTAHVTTVGTGNTGRMAFGVLNDEGVLSAESWSRDGLFLVHKPGEECSIDLVERIGDLPGQPEPVPQANKRAELRERLLVAAIGGMAASMSDGDAPRYVGMAVVDMVDAALDALDKPAHD